MKLTLEKRSCIASKDENMASITTNARFTVIIGDIYGYVKSPPLDRMVQRHRTQLVVKSFLESAQSQIPVQAHGSEG